MFLKTHAKQMDKQSRQDMVAHIMDKTNEIESIERDFKLFNWNHLV